MTSFIEIENHGTVRLVRLNRPEARNALHAPMREELIACLSAADVDEAISAVVLTGNGPTFCAGVDFKVHDHPPARQAQFLANPAKALRAMTTPVICAVNGACVSGGLEIALSCSFVIAAESARFADTHARLGVVATWGLTALLPRAVGIRYAARMSLTGEFVEAAEALRVGLVTEVVSNDYLVAHALRLATQIPGGPAVTDLVQLVRQGENLGLAAALDLETASSLTRAVDLDGFSAAGRSLSVS